MNTITIEHLSKVYGNGVKALDDVSLSINNGMFGLLGPNGAGKSTLMRTLATLQDATEGTITFNGEDIAENPQHIRSQLGYLPQEFGVYPNISAQKLLEHLAVLKGISHKNDRKEQVAALLQKTNLYEHRKKAVSIYSGGMKRRFGIAQALLGNPRLIIVDEPTAGLDPEERNRFHNLLSQIGENIIILLSTHIIEDVRDLCTDMAILVNGQVVQQGIPVELIEKIEGKIWHKTIARDELEAYRSAFAVISEHLFAGKMQIHVLADERPETGFESISPDLEDVYFSTLYQPQEAN